MMKKSSRLVLYADDDSDDLHFVREAFSRHATDIELITFLNAVDLLEFIHNRSQWDALPCLVILDINMPRMNGKDALRLLRNIENWEDVPVVLFTTSTAPHDRFFADHYKAGFFTKPLSEEQMDRIVEQFLEHCNEGIKE